MQRKDGTTLTKARPCQLITRTRAISIATRCFIVDKVHIFQMKPTVTDEDRASKAGTSRCNPPVAIRARVGFPAAKTALSGRTFVFQATHSRSEDLWNFKPETRHAPATAKPAKPAIATPRWGRIMSSSCWLPSLHASASTVSRVSTVAATAAKTAGPTMAAITADTSKFEGIISL